MADSEEILEEVDKIKVVSFKWNFERQNVLD